MQHCTNDVTRRDLLRAAGIAAGAAAAATVALPNCTPTLAVTPAEAAELEAGGEIAERVTVELPTPEMAAPEVTEYEADVLVIGGGYAGLNAAVAAAEAGLAVVLIDKGTPGYAGLSAWPGTHAWFDPDFDDREAVRESILRAGEYMSNQTWLDIWLDESKATKERLEGWGFLDRYEKASSAGDYWANDNYVGYNNEIVGEHDRHKRFMGLLAEKGVTVLTHTMITKVVVEDNRVKGAIGFHVASATPIRCSAKSVVMCMGQGAFKVQGWPAAADTFDGENILYDLGLAIVNKETEDYHSTNNTNPGHCFMATAWNYLENFWFCPISSVDPEDLNAYGRAQCRFILYNTNYCEGTSLVTKYSHSPARTMPTVEENGGDERTGRGVDGNWTDGESAFRKTGGASPGFCGHLMPGAHLDWDDDCGFTGIEGLYVAGDGMAATPPNGFGYGQIHGLTSSFVSTQGWRAGNASAAYVAGGVELEPIADDVYAAEVEHILAPLVRAQESSDCFDAMWCVNVLTNVMTPYFAMYQKDDVMLEAALRYVEKLRDDVVPKLAAANAHDLRMCHEAANKVRSAEMKLRASLARKESRGFCFHDDYQYRNDDEFLCQIGCVKQEDGTMGIETFPIPEEWRGDVDEDYNTRYPNPFPGEEEALRAMGWDITRPEPQLTSSWSK